MATARKVVKKKNDARATRTLTRKSTRKPKTVARKRIVSTNGNKPNVVAKPILNQKQTLEQERVQVESELANLRAEMQQAPELTGDEVDLNVYERERTLGLVYAYERRLDEIDATLRVAAQGKYGICERCGKPIDPERLKIFPETRLCVDCKNQVEREQRRLRM